jgi:glucose dehydrogenase
VSDVCVIGSGFAGSTVAHRLALGGARVTILETGIDHRQPIPERCRVRYTNVGPITYMFRDVSFRCIGGTSEHWYGNTPRPHPNDLQTRSVYGVGEDWPLTYEELEPHLEESERVLGTAGADDEPHHAPRRVPFPLPAWPLSHSDRLIREGLAEAGIPVLSTPQARTTRPYRGRPRCLNLGRCNTCPINARTGATASSLRWALETGRVELISEATVLRLESDDRGRITEAIWVDPAGQTHRQRADLFILAAHVPDSVRLLLHSTSQRWPAGIGNGEDMVGRCFMDHGRHNARAEIEERTWPNRLYFQTAAIHHWADAPDRADRGAYLIEILNYIGSAGPGSSTHDTDLWGLPLKRHVRENWGHSIQFHAGVEMLPDRDNRITLDPEVMDTNGVPIARFDLRFDDYALAGYASVAASMDRMLEILGARNVLHRPMREGQLVSIYHPAGGLRMGRDSATSVTDPWGQVHGIPNLFAAGTALFPTIGTVNPTLTMIALALRTSERIEFLAGRGEI